MIAGNQALRALIIYGMCLPLAVTLGYIMASPVDMTGFAAAAVTALVLLTPIMMRWHHELLILSWNTTAVVPYYVLPIVALATARINVWMALVVVSLAFSLGRRALMTGVRLVNVPSITWPLIAIIIVVYATALATGGIGFAATGSETAGGKRYLTLLMAIAGYYALSLQRIPLKSAGLMTGLFFLGGATMAIGSLYPYVDPSFYFIFHIFPLDKAMPILGYVDSAPVERVFGLGYVAPALVGFFLAKYGVRGVLMSRVWWRFPVFMGSIALGMFGGYRSLLILVLLIFGIMFCLEGLHRSKMLPVIVLIFLGGAAVLLPFARHLPASFQRTMAFLPIDVDPLVKLDAETTSDWRLRMWKALLPEVPNNLLLGRGLSIVRNELDLAQEKMKGHYAEDFYMAIVSGDFHNGPLTLLIPFGIWGFFAFIWLAVAGLRLLHRNCRYGDPALLTVNRLLLAAFIAQLLLYFFIFGSFHTDLHKFLGILGLSVALNGGMAKPVAAPAPQPTQRPVRISPLLRPVRPALGR